MINMGETMWAWVTEEPNGSISTIAVGDSSGDMMMPLIGRSEQHIRSMEHVAQAHGKATGQPYWLRRYRLEHDYR